MKKKQKGKRLRKSKIQDQDLEPKAIQEMKNKKEDKKDKNDKPKKNKKIKKAKLLLIIVSIIIIIFGSLLNPAFIPNKDKIPNDIPRPIASSF